MMSSTKQPKQPKQPKLEWYASPKQANAMSAQSEDWTYTLVTATDGTGYLHVRASGTTPSATAFKYSQYTTSERAKRAAQRFEQEYTRSGAVLQYRDMSGRGNGNLFPKSR